jgi:TadE-like protein
VTNRQRGQAMLEFAIILPVACILLFGGINAIFAASEANTVTTITAQVAECLEQNGTLCTGTNTASTYAASLATGLGLTNAANLSVTGGACSSGACTAKLSYTSTPIIPPFFVSFTLTRSYSPERVFLLALHESHNGKKQQTNKCWVVPRKRLPQPRFTRRLGAFLRTCWVRRCLSESQTYRYH